MDKLGIFVPIIGFGRKGFYNSQEIGIGKAFAKRGYDVSIIKCLKRERNEQLETLQLQENLKITYYYCGHIGVHALIDLSILDPQWDRLIVFSDNQLCIPKVSKWCKAHNVTFVPYVGIIHSFGNNIIKQKLMNLLFNIGTCRVYKQSTVVVKNTFVQKKLMSKGVNNTLLAPVGLDFSVLHVCENENIITIRKKWGFRPQDRILIFIGILTEEKRPLDALDIIRRLHEEDNNYKMILIGKGPLKAEVERLIKHQNMVEYVNYIEEIPNKDIWELHFCADIYINLWEQEIFGMAILEALYYNNFVVAIDAPGPNTILSQMRGCKLCKSIDEVIESIRQIDCNKKELLINNRKQLDLLFNWNNSISIFEKVMDGV